MLSLLSAFFLITDNQSFQQLARLLSECRYPDEYHCIIKIEYLGPDLNTSWWGIAAWPIVPFSSVTCGTGAENFLSAPKLCITLIWSNLHTDKEPRTQEKSWGKTLWTIHYSLVYSVNIHWISRMYKIYTAVVSLSFEGFFPLHHKSHHSFITNLRILKNEGVTALSSPSIKPRAVHVDSRRGSGRLVFPSAIYRSHFWCMNKEWVLSPTFLWIVSIVHSLWIFL